MKLRKLVRAAHYLTPFTGGPLRDKKLRKRLHLTGKQVKSKLFGAGSVNSAGSYAYARGEYYGPTGSIVGRY